MKRRTLVAISNDSDNPIFDGIFDFCQMYCGASIGGVFLRVVMNRCCVSTEPRLEPDLRELVRRLASREEGRGFWFLLRKRHRSGYLGVVEVAFVSSYHRRVYPRVMYIDIDIHHGDGVEEAFYLTNRVMTVSFHKYGNYFPGTGNVTDVGLGEGKNYAVNIPLKDGMDDKSYKYIFEPVCVDE